MFIMFNNYAQKLEKFFIIWKLKMILHSKPINRIKQGSVSGNSKLLILIY